MWKFQRVSNYRTHQVLENNIEYLYVNDLNILGTSGEISQKIEHIKKEFEFNMKGFGKTRLYIGLYIEHLEKKILMHQMTYIDNVLKKFDMD